MDNQPNRLKELRQKQGISLDKLSKELQQSYQITLSPSQLMYYEKGERKPRNSETWDALADYFGVQVSYLLGYSDFMTSAEEDFFHTTGYPMNSSSNSAKKVIKIDMHRNALSDDEFMTLPPEERKKYIGEYLDAMGKALSSLTDTVANTAEITADVTGEQISKLSDSLIQALAKLSNIKNKD